MNHYEIHVTVATDDVNKFREICEQIGVKPIVIELQAKNGSKLFNDVMTSSKFTGYEYMIEVKRISEALKSHGYKILRQKVEEDPSNKPSGTTLYYESHIRLLVETDDISRLRQFCNVRKLFISKNIFKQPNDPSCNLRYIMATYRSHTNTLLEFRTELLKFVDELEQQEFAQDKIEVERAIYDTNENHDIDWINNKLEAVL